MPARARFGDFFLHERLAVGGMGELFLATRVEGTSPPLAVKVLLREFRENPEFVAMFQDEARIGMCLSHRNIVGVYESGIADATPYIVLEYIHGENLRAVLRELFMRRERVPPELAVKIAIDVLLGLERAHRAKDAAGQPLNLVHRDLSPDNIIVSYDGDVKILDFGIAKAEGRATQTMVGVIKGKAQYMSPEQASQGSVDARSDLFAAALVLLEALTGEKRLLQEDAALQREEARTWKPYEASSKVPGLPVELDAILLKALQTDPARRWQTADEFAAGLTRLLLNGNLPRAKETLPAFLKRLFPSAVEKKPAIEEPTVVPSASAEPVVAAAPRWAREDDDRTRTAENLAMRIDSAALSGKEASATTSISSDFRPGAIAKDTRPPPARRRPRRTTGPQRPAPVARRSTAFRTTLLAVLLTGTVGGVVWSFRSRLRPPLRRALEAAQLEGTPALLSTDGSIAISGPTGESPADAKPTASPKKKNHSTKKKTPL